VAFPLGLDKVRLFQNPHVMGDGRLRQLYSLFNVKSAEASFLVDGAPAFFFQSAQNSAARGIRNCMEKSIEIGRSASHQEEGYQTREAGPKIDGLISGSQIPPSPGGRSEGKQKKPYFFTIGL